MTCEALGVKMLILSVSVSFWTVIVPAQTTGVSQPILEVMIGTNVTLECFLSEDSKEEPINWFKQNIGELPQYVGTIQRILSSSLFNEFNNERFKLQKVSGSFYLSIANIISSDEGSYFCGIAKQYSEIKYGKATYLIVKERGELRSNTTELIQAALLDPVHVGDSETLECVVLSESRTEDLRVFWFRPASGGSHPLVIYTNKSWTGTCEGRCVYSLPKKDVNISDAGTYYCGIATSGQILFGNGTALVVAEPVNTVLVGLVVALGCCVALMLWLNCKTGNASVNSTYLHVRNDGSDSTQKSAQMHLDDVVFTTVIYNIKAFKSQRK